MQTTPREIHAAVKPIINATYGRNNMADTLAEHLSERIADAIPSKRLHGIILRTCWDLMPGRTSLMGTTAKATADKIIVELDKKGML